MPEAPSAPGDEGLGTARQENKFVTVSPPTSFLNPTCLGAASSHAVSNPGAPSHEVSTCAAADGFSFADAVAACGSAVKYFSYSCTDFAVNPPYRLNSERGWTSYYGCCAPTCSDGLQNHGEEGIDCGGPCAPCVPTCSDGLQNQDEEGIDCGGTCVPCQPELAGGADGIDGCVGSWGQCTACYTGDTDCGGLFSLPPWWPHPYVGAPFRVGAAEFLAPGPFGQSVSADFSGPDGSILTVILVTNGSFSPSEWAFASLDYGAPITGILPLGCTGSMPFVSSSFTATSVDIRTDSVPYAGTHSCSFQITY